MDNVIRKARLLRLWRCRLREERNNVRGKETIISADDSKVKVVLVPTDEEIVIARDTRDLVAELKK